MTNLNFTLLAVMSAFFGALATLLARPLLRDLKSKDMLSISFFTIAAILLLFSPLFYHFQATLLTMSLLVLISLVDTAANYFYFKTFEKTEASVAAPLLSLAPIYTFLLSWIFLNDHASVRSLLLSLIVVIGIIVFSTDFSKFDDFKRSTLWPAMISSVLFGISAVPSKYLLSSLHAINAPTLYMFRASFIALFSTLLFHFTVGSISVKQYRLIFSRGLVVIAQWLLLYYALSIGSAGVTITLGNITPIFVFFLSMIFLREKPTIKKFVAAACVLVFSLLV